MSFLLKFAAVFAVIIATWWVIKLALDARPKLYKALAPWILLRFTETLHERKKWLERIVHWLDGRTFREMPARVLAEICLQALENCQYDTPDLIRVVEIIHRYGTVMQRDSFVRAVIREARTCNAVDAPKLFDVLRRNEFKIGPKAYAMAEIAAAHAARDKSKPGKDHASFQKLLARRQRVSRALGNLKAASRPRKGQVPARGQRASDHSALQPKVSASRRRST